MSCNIGDWSSGMIGVSKTFGGSSILSSPVDRRVRNLEFWCATRQVDKLNNENFFFPGTVYVPGCLCNAF